jgi:hypothetical protein
MHDHFQNSPITLHDPYHQYNFLESNELPSQPEEYILPDEQNYLSNQIDFQRNAFTTSTSNYLQPQQYAPSSSNPFTTTSNYVTQYVQENDVPLTFFPTPDDINDIYYHYCQFPNNSS